MNSGIRLLALLLGCLPQILQAQQADSVFRVDSIHIEGNRKTHSSVILRELSFSLGDTIQNWNYHKKQSRKQLINLFLFNEIGIHRRENAVFIMVTERWYVWPVPELGYADRNFNQWWLTRDLKRLIYGVNLEWYNMRGRNETMVLSMVSGYTRMAAMSYKIPYFNKKQTWGMQVSALYNSNKEVWYKTENDKVQFFRDRDRNLITRKNVELVLTHRKKIFAYHHLYSGYRQTDVQDTVLSDSVNPNYLQNGLSRQQELYLGYQFVYDRRDYKGFPLNGSLLRLNLEFSNYFLPGRSDFRTTLIKASYSRYFRIAGELFASANATARFYRNEFPPYSRAQALGYGKDYVRGYELLVADGSHFVLGKSELKYRFLNRKIPFMPALRNYEVLPLSLFFSVYMDAAYVHQSLPRWPAPVNNRLPNSWQRGLGAGLNIVMFYDYCARLEYSFDQYGRARTYLSFVASM